MQCRRFVADVKAEVAQVEVAFLKLAECRHALEVDGLSQEFLDVIVCDEPVTCLRLLQSIADAKKLASGPSLGLADLFQLFVVCFKIFRIL